MNPAVYRCRFEKKGVEEEEEEDEDQEGEPPVDQPRPSNDVLAAVFRRCARSNFLLRGFRAVDVPGLARVNYVICRCRRSPVPSVIN